MKFLKRLEKIICYCCCFCFPSAMRTCRRRRRRESSESCSSEDLPLPLRPKDAAAVTTMEKIRRERTQLKEDDFNFLEFLGKGHYAKVVLAEYTPRNMLVAVKALRKAKVPEKLLKSELSILQRTMKTPHPCIISFYGSFETDGLIAIALEYAPGGTLAAYCEKKTLTKEQVKFCGGCITLGLQYLHTQSIIYRDLKMENLLIDHFGYIKITDFGLSKEGIGFGDRAYTMCGTRMTIAPEIILGMAYTRSVDWWSFGVVFFYLNTRRYPFAGKDVEELTRNILSSDAVFPQHLAEEEFSLLSGLLNKDPERRLGGQEEGALEIKDHKYFRDTDWEAFLAGRVRSPFALEQESRSESSSATSLSEEESRISTTSDHWTCEDFPDRCSRPGRWSSSWPTIQRCQVKHLFRSFP